MNKGLKALKKASPEAYSKIMGMDKRELNRMAAKGMKVLKQYFSGGVVVPHAVYDPIGSQDTGMQNFVNAAANAEIDRDRKNKRGKTPKPEDMKEMNSMLIAEVPGAMDNDGLRALGAAPGLMIGGPSAGPATMTIPRSGTGGSGMGQLGMGDGIKVMKDGGLYAENGKKNKDGDEEDEIPLLTPQAALAMLAAQNPGVEVRGSTADTARSLPGGLGTTTAVSSTATPMVGFVDPRGDVAPEQPAVVVRPEGISPMRPLKAGLPQTGLPKELLGGMREIQTPEGPRYTFEAKAMPGNPTAKPDSGHVAGSGKGGLMHASGIELVGFEDGKRLPGLDAGGAAPGLFYLPEATGVPLFQDSPVNLRGQGVYGSDFTNLQSMDTGKYKNITDIYDLYGEDAYMAALGELQKQGVDLDQYDFPIEFDRPSRFDPNNPMTSSKTGFTARPADLLRSRASRSTEGRVVSGTGRIGDPAMMGGTGKMATQGSVGRGQRDLLNYFQRQAERARQEFGPNSPEAKAAEDLIAQNFGSGGKMYGGGGVRAIKSYGYGGKY